MDNILKLENISKMFGGNYVLKDICLEFKRGEIHSVIGENGAGKSTLIKILGGVYKPNSGVIYKDGQKVNINNPTDAFVHKIGIVHQELSLSGNMSVAENIFAGRQPVNKIGLIDEKKMNSMAASVVDSMGVILDPTEKVSNLSMALQQIVEIVRVVSRNIDVLILDEPTSSLSKNETDHIFELIRRMRKERNLTVIFISHKLHEVIEISDRVSVLRNGILIGTISGGEITAPNMISMMVGRELTNKKLHSRKSNTGEAILRVSNLCNGKIFRNISFELYPNEVVGLFGLVGAGRTELAHSIIGAGRLESGEIEYMGEKVRFKSPKQAIKVGISYLTENRRDLGLFMSKPLYDNVTASSLQQYTTRFGTIDKSRVNEASNEYVNSLSINPNDINKKAISFSGGNQQKILFAKTLLSKPKVLIVDEPTRGVDVGVKITIQRMLRKLAEQGIALLMISSELPEILAVTDRIMVMHEGRLKGIMENDSLEEKDVMEVVYKKEA